VKPFIVAEMGANHLGSLGRALEIVDAAADAGADAIKVQTWTPGTMCIDREYVIDHGPWKGMSLFALYDQAFLPWAWHRPIFDRARQLGLVPFSAAFDRGAVDFLEELGVDRHKVASFELVDLPLIRYMASKGKPMILSTGMASEDEILDAILACNDGCVNSANEPTITILKCTSAYPTELSDANLKTMAEWARGYCLTGLSDHTLGHEAAVVATALGASYIEKHLTLARVDGGLDATFSMEPHEFKAMVQAVRRAALTLGTVSYGPHSKEAPGLRRSLWVAQDTLKGDPLVLGVNIVTARPAMGLGCDTDLAGRVAAQYLSAGKSLQAEDVE
jgi:pseudaminic acid synthase